MKTKPGTLAKWVRILGIIFMAVSMAFVIGVAFAAALGF